MLIDHIGALFPTDPQILRLIGRISFPLFAFCVGIGLKHTRDIKKYIFRMFIFALITIIPFNMFSFLSRVDGDITFRVIFIPTDFSVMFTFLASALCVYIYQNTFLNKNNNNLKLFGVIMIGFVLILCEPSVINIPLDYATDYGTLGAALPFFVYLFDDKKMQMLMIAIFMALIYVPTSLFYLGLLVFSYFSLIFIYYYNGEKGRSSKYLFYIFYPLHMLILVFIRILI